MFLCFVCLARLSCIMFFFFFVIITGFQFVNLMLNLENGPSKNKNNYK